MSIVEIFVKNIYKSRILTGTDGVSYLDVFTKNVSCRVLSGCKQHLPY